MEASGGGQSSYPAADVVTAIRLQISTF